MNDRAIFWVKVGVMLATIIAGMFVSIRNSSPPQQLDYRIDENRPSIEIDL